MRQTEATGFQEITFCGAELKARDPITEKSIIEIEQVYKADCPMTGHRAGDRFVRTWVSPMNLVMNGGASLMWQRSITRNPTTALNAALSALSTGAMIAVGTSTASSGSQNIDDLQAADNSTSRHGERMSASSYPAHTDGTASSGARQVQFRGVFATGDANFAWREWGLFNGTSGGPSTAFDGRMLNRTVVNLGTKTSAAQWTFTATVKLD